MPNKSNLAFLEVVWRWEFGLDSLAFLALFTSLAVILLSYWLLTGWKCLSVQYFCSTCLHLFTKHVCVEHHFCFCLMLFLLFDVHVLAEWHTNMLIGQVLLLESTDTPSRTVIVATTHLFFHPRAAHIRIIQAAICIRHIENQLYQLQQQVCYILMLSYLWFESVSPVEWDDAAQ